MLDAENGYCLTPMEQGIRLTTGAEFAARDAPPTPVQFERLMPAARELFRARRAGRGAALARRAAMLCRIRARSSAARPAQRGLWLAYGHGHWGLTLGPATGRLIAEMMTGATPFCDPAPYCGRSGFIALSRSIGRRLGRCRMDSARAASE